MESVIIFFEQFIIKWAELWQMLSTPLSTYYNVLPQAWQVVLYVAWAPLYFLKDLTIIELITTHVAVIFFVLVIVKLFKLVNPLD